MKNKIDEIGYHHKDTGELIDKYVVDSIIKEQKVLEKSTIYKKYRKDISSLTEDELIKLMRWENNSLSVHLDFSEDGYFICRRDVKNTLKLSIYTRAFLFSVSHMMTHEGRLIYENNRLVKTIRDLRDYLSITKGSWDRYVNKDIKKYNMLKKEKIDNKWCLLLNPIYSTTTRKVTETLFIAFHKELKGYLKDYEYAYCEKKYMIKLD